MVELIDDRNHRVQLVVKNGLDGKSYPGLDEDRSIGGSFASYLKTLETHTIEVLCVEVPIMWGYDQADEVLSSMGGVRTFVLSNSDIEPYLLPLDPEHGYDSDGSMPDPVQWRCQVLEHLVIYEDLSNAAGEDIMRFLPGLAERRKAAGRPFKSVTMFSRSPWSNARFGPMGSCRPLEKLRKCVGKLEVVVGDDVLDWSVDDYFFGGLPIRRDRHFFEV
jgi:hypothetical protein